MTTLGRREFLADADSGKTKIVMSHLGGKEAQ